MEATIGGCDSLHSSTPLRDDLFTVTDSRQPSLFTEAELPPNLLPWEIAAGEDRLLAEVVFNRPLTTIFQYLVPNELREMIGPGQRVQVPFGRGDKLTIGFCVGLTTQFPQGRAIKTLAALIDREALLDARMLELTRWIAERYLCGWGQVLESIIPRGVKSKAGTREVTFFGLAPVLREQLFGSVPSPPSSGERARMMGPSCDAVPSDSNDSALAPFPRRGDERETTSPCSSPHDRAAPLPNPPRRGAGIREEEDQQENKGEDEIQNRRPLTLALSPQGRGEGTRGEETPHPNPLPTTEAAVPEARGEGTGEGNDRGAVPQLSARHQADVLANLKLPAKQRSVIEVLVAAGRPMRVDELSEAAQCGTAPIHGLRDKRLIVALRERVLTAPVMPTPEVHREISLNPDQQRAVDSILSVVRAAEHRTLLLHGVTGSGKTEVYIRAIEEVVSYGRQAIVLVPEISLTPQTIRRFASRFPSVAVLHSHLTDAERHGHWQQIASGAVQVVVGARSAIFAPTPHLGLIVIDEEHETSFKQDSTPRYHAREVARRRAELERVPLILGSATPTLESYLKVLRKEDVLISMPKRVAQLPLPPVVIVDIRNDPAISKGSAIGRALFTSMLAALKEKGQIILFLNVRGFSPVLWCRGCGEGVKCPDCDITLTYHKERAVALCHSCDRSGPLPAVCPKCGKPGLLNLGIGTERLEAEVRARFPHVTCLRMDSDTMSQRGSHDVALEKFRHGEVQILLGTQMIAKGLDFPNVTLVGVIDADTLLHQPDIRSMERTFQLIAQVAGRTGRSAKGGRVLVQTSSPEQPPIVRAAAHDFIGFATDELRHRQALKVPPFSHMGRVIIRGPDEKEVHAYSDKVGELMRAAAKELSLDVRILGPAPCLVTRLKANFRYHLQLTSVELSPLQQLWLHAAPQFPSHPEVEFIVDVDPLNLR